MGLQPGKSRASTKITNLKSYGFTPTSWHQSKRILTGSYRLDNFFLQWSETGIPPVFYQYRLKFTNHTNLKVLNLQKYMKKAGLKVNL